MMGAQNRWCLKDGRALPCYRCLVPTTTVSPGGNLPSRALGTEGSVAHETGRQKTGGGRDRGELRLPKEELWMARIYF